MNVLISGGCKNGKTAFALDIAARLSHGGSRYYVATMIPYDSEDRARITRHIEERKDSGFKTLELARDISLCLEKAEPRSTFLIDSVTALLLNEMFPRSFSQEADKDAVDRCRNGLMKIVDGAENAVFVSDYIFSDAARYDEFTENYRAWLASLDRALAKACDTVVELCAGNAVIHKGVLPE